MLSQNNTFKSDQIHHVGHIFLFLFHMSRNRWSITIFSPASTRVADAWCWMLHETPPQHPKSKCPSGEGCVSCHRTAQTSRIQNLALQVGQGTLLDNHVSGLCSSRRLANHRPRHSRHHMGLQKHCWQSESSMSASGTDSRHTGTVTSTSTCKPTHTQSYLLHGKVWPVWHLLEPACSRYSALTPVYGDSTYFWL